MYQASDAEFTALLAQIKLLVLDVDGVLTDGGLYYTETGEELKKFNVKDGLGIQLVRQLGIEVAIISAGVSNATLYRAKRLGISHVFTAVQNKRSTLIDLCEQLNIPFSQVAYAGDDLVDLPAMQLVGCPLTVADAMPENQAIACYVTQKAGGQGAVREICDLIRHAVHASQS